MMNFLLGVVFGVVIGWFSEFYLLRNKYASEAAALRESLSSERRKVSELERKIVGVTSAADRATQLETANADLQARLDECMATVASLDSINIENEESSTKEAHEDAEASAAAGETSLRDDLKRIEGIGPKLSSVLNDAGIHTFSQLAACSADQLQEILNSAGIARISSPDTWPEQARLAARGAWDELKELQTSLKGGRRA